MAGVRTAFLAYALSSVALCQAFVVSPFAPAAADSARAAPALRSRSHVELVAAPEQESESFSLTGLVTAAGLLTIAAAGRRATRSRTGSRMQRRITLQEIENLTIEDLPPKWKDYVTVRTARRHAVMESIKAQLPNTYFIMAWNKDGMECDKLAEARSMFPQHIKMRSLRNEQMVEAMAGTKWEEFSKNLKGNSMYCFVESEEDVKPCVQAYAKMDKQFKRQQVLDRLIEKHPEEYATFPAKPLLGSCLAEDYKFLNSEQTWKLKDMPTKLDLIARVAGGVKQVTQKIAVGINQLPKKIAVGTKKIVEKMEEDGKSSVADVVVA